VAARVASLLPDSLLLTLPTMGHSALDFREPAALGIAASVWRGELDELANQASTLDAIPARPAQRLLWKAVDVVAAAEGALPPIAPLWRRLRSA
jgi:proline iminopeptidase